jgi:virginiamycin A acetyltransferase
VAPYTIVGGNPAKIVKQRFSQEVVADLQVIKWWDWPVDKITRNRSAITACDLPALRNAV